MGKETGGIKWVNKNKILLFLTWVFLSSFSINAKFQKCSENVFN